MYKVALIGGCGVGKTSFLKRLHGRRFSAKYEPTHRLLFETTIYEDIEYFDYSGNIDTINNIDFTEFDGVVLMFDFGSRISFQHMNEFRKTLEVPYILVGNKNDGPKQVRKIEENVITMSCKNINDISTLHKNVKNLVNPYHSKYLAKITLKELTHKLYHPGSCYVNNVLYQRFYQNSL